jgi:dTMP kinase
VVSRLDVIAELAAHQHNVRPEPVVARSVVVALPAPPLIAWIAPAWYAAARAPVLQALAEDLGGGDGPLAIIELGADDITARLAALWERGTRQLIVPGAPDQPGYARALSYRWPGALQLLALSCLDPWLDPRVPVRVLAPGVVCVAPGIAAPPGAARVLAAVDDDGDPRRVAEQGAHVWPCAIDPARRLGAWAGAVPPRGRFGTAAGAELRARWDAYWSGRGRPEVVRNAVLGLDPSLEADLRAPEPPDLRPTSRRARLIAITGIDGAGKSSQVARLAQALHDRGAHVRVIKLYRQGAFLELANQLSARTRRGGPLAAFRVSRIIKLVDSLRVLRDHLAPAMAVCDAVLLDRYVETHLAAAESQLGWDLSSHPAVSPFPAPDLRCWLQLDPDIALERREARGEPASADEHAVGLRGYAQVFARLAQAPGELVLDATHAELDNARAIAERAVAVLPGSLPAPGRDGDRSSLVPPAAAPRVTAAACAVHVGVDATRTALGADAFAVRAELARWCGGAAAGIPEGFWLEAYAAQLVLDVMTQAPARGAVALWPAAVAAMPGHGELDTLVELARMLAPRVTIEHYDPRPETYEPAFRALGASEPAARRLAGGYAAELVRIATEHGWPRAPSSER